MITPTAPPQPRRWGLRGAAAAATALCLAFGMTAPAWAVGRDVDAPWAGNAANPVAGATDYYVDATNGADTNPGTSPDSAWQTLAKVNATTFQPGDRILLKAGEEWQDQQLWPKGSGSEAARITIDAYGDQAAGLPYIAANGTTPSPFIPESLGERFPRKNSETIGLTGAVVLRNQEHWNIRNLELSNDDDFGTNITTERVARDGVNVSINADLFPVGTPVEDTVMRGITVENLHVHDIDGPSSWQRVHYGGVNFQVFGERQNTEYAAGGYHFEDVRITNNTFENVELHAVQFGFNWFGEGFGQVDPTGKFHEGWEQLWVRDRDLYSRDVYIGHNYAEDTGQGPYQLANTKDMVVEYNEANGWLQRYDQVSAGLYLWAGADTVMRFNEIYDGPANQYDATPWDLEFTNFNVRYEWNYSHDNEGGWMSYMGNSGNSIARYNLSVNDNGVIWKNMLSTNYSPTYVLNNTFVYDGAELDSFHDEVLKDRVYFANNIFYNTSTTTPTTWAAKPGGLARGVFSNNAFFEASGQYTQGLLGDANAVVGDPKFTGNWADYAKNAGVDRIRQSASLFQLQPDSPLIDAGRYNERIGTQDFFGDPNYRGDAPDIGIHEVQAGATVTNPVDTDPIENTGVETRTSLATGKPIVASSTHPADSGTRLAASKMVDNDDTTRWAAADEVTYPVTIDIDFGAATAFDEVVLQEFTDSGTEPRIAAFRLQSWDGASGTWTTFYTGDGVGTERVIEFDQVTSAKLRLSIDGVLAGASGTPTISEFRVYGDAPTDTDPTVTPASALHDRNVSVATVERNMPAFAVDLDGDTVSSVRYVTTSGALVGSLDAGDLVQSRLAENVYQLTPAFYADKQLGTSGLDFQFASGKTVRVTIEIVDTTDLETAIALAERVPVGTSPEHQALAVALAAAKAELVKANRGEGTTTHAAVTTATSVLRSAIEAVDDEPTTFVDVLPTTQFFTEISWLAEHGITRGWELPDGTTEFRPVTPVARDAMAAFLYRLADEPPFTAPEVSPFTDVATDNQFYKEIAWLAEQEISTGWSNGDGTFSFRPLEPIARDAMAAFLFRYADVDSYDPPATSPFDDVATSSQFYLEIAWLAETGIATGWQDGNDGTTIYRPLTSVNRDAMAAFMFRLVTSTD